MLDFLKEIVEAVPDPSAGGTIDLESENAEGKKKRGKGKKAGTTGEPAKKRRRKKADTEAEAEGAGEPDAEMKSEPEDQTYDNEQDGRRVRHVATNYRPRSPSSEDEEPFMPRH